MIKRYATLVIALLFASGCSKWPPHERDVKRHFKKHRDSFEALAVKMRETDYWRISYESEDSIEVDPVPPDQISESFILEGAAEWAQLLNKTGMYLVAQSDDWVSMSSGAAAFSDFEDIWGFLSITYDPRMLEGYKLCRPEHRRVGCGRCAVHLDGDWYISYEWSQKGLVPEARERLWNGEISEEEHAKVLGVALRACYEEGLSRMGYDVDAILRPEE